LNEQVIDLDLLAISLERGRVLDKEMDHAIPLVICIHLYITVQLTSVVQDNINPNTSINVPRKSIYERELESLMSTVSSLFITHIYPDHSQDDELGAAETRSEKGKGKAPQKRSARPINTGNDRRKVCRVSAGDVMTTMTGSMEDIFDSLKDVFSDVAKRRDFREHAQAQIQAQTQAQATATVTRSEAKEIEHMAMEAIQNDEGFSDKDIVDAASTLQEDPGIASMYLLIKSKKARTTFLLRKMKKFKGED